MAEIEVQSNQTFSCELAECVQDLAFVNTKLSQPLKSIPPLVSQGMKRAFVSGFLHWNQRRSVVTVSPGEQHYH